MNSPIVRFYSGESPDDSGRMMADIQRWSDQRLESVHDYIQWLFPLPEESGANPSAPVLTEADIRAFRDHPELRQRLRESFLRMLSFYGLSLRDEPELAIEPSKEFATRSANWVRAGNHNHLRITRILWSLHLLGLEEEAQAFFAFLEKLYARERHAPWPRISPVTFRYWQAAAGQLSR